MGQERSGGRPSPRKQYGSEGSDTCQPQGRRGDYTPETPGEPCRGGGEEGDQEVFHPSKLDGILLSAQGGEEPASRRLQEAPGGGEEIEEVTKKNENLNLETQSRRG